MDAAWYYTAPGLAWDAALKMTGVELELLTDPDMLLMIEKGIRGGISIISKRHGKANNKYMGEEYDPSQPSKAAFMLILRRQNQRFETLIQNADPKRPSREYCSCFPREEDDFVSMHCALFEAIVRAQVNRKGVYMTSFKRGYM